MTNNNAVYLRYGLTESPISLLHISTNCVACKKTSFLGLYPPVLLNMSKFSFCARLHLNCEVVRVVEDLLFFIFTTCSGKSDEKKLDVHTSGVLTSSLVQSANVDIQYTCTNTISITNNTYNVDI